LQSVGIGLVGLGTVGSGVVKILQGNASVLEERLGFPLRLVHIVTRSPEENRDLNLSGIRIDSDLDALLANDDIQVVLELVGGTDAARELVLSAIEAGKNVVTANKALLADFGKEIFDAAEKRGVDVAFEASVAGGIPVLRVLREGLAANRIESIHGIMNGTTNYMLTEMESTGEAFDEVLKRAQDLGYAEADPTFDVDGIDAAQKLVLLAGMAFGVELSTKDVHCEGIRPLTPSDFEAASSFGYRIKLLGIAKPHGEGDAERIELRVHPAMVPAKSLLANVDGAMNAVAVTGDAVGPTLYYGAGAGEMATASAVVGDIMEVARAIERGNAGRVAPLSYMPDHMSPKPILPLDELSGDYYLRFTAKDQSGVLAHITGILGEYEIGIRSVLQKGEGDSSAAVPVMVMTHRASESKLREALEKIDQLPDVAAPTVMIRIEEGV
jgi:homoserine dehydrogenase